MLGGFLAKISTTTSKSIRYRTIVVRQSILVLVSERSESQLPAVSRGRALGSNAGLEEEGLRSSYHNKKDVNRSLIKNEQVT
jgi:hypothetical protein